MEIFDIVDENGIPTGETIQRTVAHDKGIRHRTAHIWIVRNTDNGCEVLLQQRSYNKDSFPGRYDTSSAGHIRAGDEPLDSALRELGEELGIKAKPAALTYIGKFPIQYEKNFSASRLGTAKWLLCIFTPNRSTSMHLRFRRTKLSP